ncbi:hypothetical protein Csa_010653 [Cucumis sativus]|uniref:Uncharacterized protein n=1 Tax=Cucumis sativus TaxID=3659 RepID=A0A0A0LAY2_CUCSA|nr:hypothetical protein Csa_010653 [Cucumis sativus]
MLPAASLSITLKLNVSSPSSSSARSWPFRSIIFHEASASSVASSVSVQRTPTISFCLCLAQPSRISSPSQAAYLVSFE